MDDTTVVSVVRQNSSKKSKCFKFTLACMQKNSTLLIFYESDHR